MAILLQMLFIVGCLLSAAYASDVIGPDDFELYWLYNNQRNLLKRYYHYSEQARDSDRGVYLLGADSAPDVRIRTDAGEQDALLGRMHIHYQTNRYLFLVDWFSVIPQPQVTEGYTYGDLVAGYTWNFPDYDTYLTLGLRQQSTPQATTLGTETVFMVTDNASHDSYSLFVHLNVYGFDVGTYYSEKNGLDALALNYPLYRTGRQTLSSTLLYYGGKPESGISETYELSVDHMLATGEHVLRSGAAISLLTDQDESGLSNLFAVYTSPRWKDISMQGGLYYSRDFQRDDTVPGWKLGLVWHLGAFNSMNLSFGVQENAVGDFNALVVPDEPILVFRVASDASF